MALKLTPEHQTDTYKAFRGVAEAGDTLPTHQTPQTALLVCLSGALSFAMGDQKTKLSGGQTMVIPAKALHSLTFEEACSFLLILPMLSPSSVASRAS
jgi:quercetin dioxygenase-like cupin family protein